MKKILLASVALTAAASLWGQSAVDAYELSQTQSRGTARFMSMGGAFTALGGDLSVLGQNPAGIGVYRRSEIGATLDISPSKFTSDGGVKQSMNKTTVACNNFGYIGTIRLDGALRTFNWGVSYARVASFDRQYNIYNPTIPNSLSNYVAAYTTNNQVDPNDLNPTKDYDPYRNPDMDWLSILSYTSSMMAYNPATRSYVGLFQNGSNGDAITEIREKGYVDEYNIDFGGNISDIVYWGIGFGIYDLDYRRNGLYSESIAGARVDPYNDGDLVNGKANFDLRNWQHINGSGWNMKVGLIVKPVNEIRIGLAVHTPTWYSLSQSAYANTSFAYAETNADGSDEAPYEGGKETDDSYYDFRLHSPWKLMVGAAGVIGNQAIISLDYERQAFGDMKIKYQTDYGDYEDAVYTNDDIKNYYKATDIIRLGAEYRLTPQLSLRAGYSYATTNVKSEAADGRTEIYTAGTNPAYTMDKDQYSISCGLGYRISSFSIDAAYVYRHKESTFHAFTPYDGIASPSAKLTQATNSIVISAAYRF